MSRRDPKGYYAVLNVSPDASREEILLSYRFLKQAYRERRQKLDIGAIQQAYETLSDAESKADYDGRARPVEGSAAPASPMIGSRFNSMAMLVGLVGVLMVVLAVVHGPRLLDAMTTFEQGDMLYMEQDGSFLGTVVAYEVDHAFRNGARARAYLLRQTDSDPGIWYPAGDLVRIAEPR